MRIAGLNWMQVEDYLKRDDRAVLPIGCVEQHAFLSLATDAILAERVAVEAAEPLGIPVFPGLAYGITPSFRAYPGTVSLRAGTLLAVVGDVLDALTEQGFRRVLIVNGHGGNSPAQSFCAEWMASHPGVCVRFHNWWNAPRVWKTVQEIDSQASHASWMENFAWTRLPGVVPPAAAKPMVDPGRLQGLGPTATRALLGDGSFGGRYQRSELDTDRLWKVAVEETRHLMESGWA
ncbi:MAG: creatininase family protein [Candidatus Eisenbacteria bacterium]